MVLKLKTVLIYVLILQAVWNTTECRGRGGGRGRGGSSSSSYTTKPPFSGFRPRPTGPIPAYNEVRASTSGRNGHGSSATAGYGWNLPDTQPASVEKPYFYGSTNLDHTGSGGSATPSWPYGGSATSRWPYGGSAGYGDLITDEDTDAYLSAIYGAYNFSTGNFGDAAIPGLFPQPGIYDSKRGDNDAAGYNAGDTGDLDLFGGYPGLRDLYGPVYNSSSSYTALRNLYGASTGSSGFFDGDNAGFFDRLRGSGGNLAGYPYISKLYDDSAHKYKKVSKTRLTDADGSSGCDENEATESNTRAMLSDTCTDLVNTHSSAKANEQASATVRLYDLPEYRGFTIALSLRPIECRTLQGADQFWNNRASSIRSESDSTCVKIYPNENCNGEFACVKNRSLGSNRLSDIKLNNEVTSLQLC